MTAFEAMAAARGRLRNDALGGMDQWKLRPDGGRIVATHSIVWPITDDLTPLIIKSVDPFDDEAQKAAFLRA